MTEIDEVKYLSFCVAMQYEMFTEIVQVLMFALSVN